MKWRFAGRFLVAFGLLVALWWWLDVGSFYRSATLSLAQPLSPLVNGWFLEVDRPGAAESAVFRKGSLQMTMLIRVQELSMALIPLISLIVATPRISLGRAARAIPAGAVLFLLIHTGIVLAYPWMLERPNLFKDTMGVFLGLVGFVVGPLGLWFALTYPELRSLWQLDQARAGSSRPRV